MVSVTQHYESHLAPVYVWMAGGIEAAIARGQAEVESVCARPNENHVAIDLGAGFGMHAIPLANLGYSVVAIDSSTVLLDVLKDQIGARAIRIISDDLMSFRRHVEAPAATILCMGDTLAHLSSRQAVEALFAEVSEALESGATFVASFRDYSVPLRGAARFIPVRSDADRILTCFLEYEEEAVTVHDILHERDSAGWHQRISTYRKLRLSTSWVVRALESRGFKVRHESGLAGMARLVAQRSA